MKIQIIGTGCEKCDKIYENTLEAVKKLNLDATIEKVEDLVEIVKLGVMTTPSLMINNNIVSKGRVLKTKEIIKLIEKFN